MLSPQSFTLERQVGLTPYFGHPPFGANHDPGADEVKINILLLRRLRWGRCRPIGGTGASGGEPGYFPGGIEPTRSISLRLTADWPGDLQVFLYRHVAVGFTIYPINI